jgi:hypothetical protein
MIELDQYARLQVHILHNDGNISSSILNNFIRIFQTIRFLFKGLLPFGGSFKSTLYLGGLPDSLNS